MKEGEVEKPRDRIDSHDINACLPFITAEEREKRKEKMKGKERLAS